MFSKKDLPILLCLTTVFITGGCGLTGGPRARWGFTPQMQYGDPNRLGTHSYSFRLSEGFGIFYTLRGGSIDLDHVRGAADLTRFTYIRAMKTIQKGGGRFRVSPAFELTTNHVEIHYPENWDKRPEAEKERIAHEAALIIAPVVGYNSTLWHEMLTWKGTRFALIEPEHLSAFSWEDVYSNLMGVELAMEAIQNSHVKEAAYNQAMTELIEQEFQRLEVVPKDKAIEITESVRGTWHATGKIYKRNMSTGYDNGWVTPSIIPGYTEAEPIERRMPTLDGLEELDIQVKYTIRSPYLETGQLKKMAGTNTHVEPAKDFAAIMAGIEAEAIDKYNYQIR